MPTVIDSSLWVDFTRAASPGSLKEFIEPYILGPETVLVEPVIFEVTRYATDRELPILRELFSLFPILPTPSGLWTMAAELGRACRSRGVNAGALDLLISSIALYHDAPLISFDEGFQRIATVSALRATVLARPTTG